MCLILINYLFYLNADYIEICCHYFIYFMYYENILFFSVQYKKSSISELEATLDII